MMASEIAALHRIRLWQNVPALGFLGLWIAAGAIRIHSRSPASRVLALVAIAGAIAAMDLVLHEAAHGRLFNGRRLNRWAGALFGAPGLLSPTAYLIYHLRHHRQSISKSASETLINGTPLYLLGVPWIAWKHADRRNRHDIAVEYTLLFAGIAAALTLSARLGVGGHVLDVWIAPLALAVVITSLRGWTELLARHFAAQPLGVTPHSLLRPIYKLTCDHLEHHIRPAIPWHNLSRARPSLEREHREAGGRGSYLQFLFEKLEGRPRRS